MGLFEKKMNPFEKKTGSERIISNYLLIPIIIILLATSVVIAKAGIIGFAGVIGFLFAITLVYFIFQNPKLGIFLLIILGFFVTGISRYIPAAWGLSIDGILVLIYLALFFKGFAQKIPWERAKSPLTVVVTIWMIYILLQIEIGRAHV